FLEDARGGIRVAPVEVGQPIAALDGAESVDLRGRNDLQASVDRAPNALLFGLAPPLNRVWHREVWICRLEGDRIGPLPRARRNFALRILAADVDRPPVAQCHADAQARPVLFAIALVILRELAEAVEAHVVIENDVYHACDGVGAILRGCTIA